VLYLYGCCIIIIKYITETQLMHSLLLVIVEFGFKTSDNISTGPSMTIFFSASLFF
jgi:hypothetical protein